MRESAQNEHYLHWIFHCRSSCCITVCICLNSS